MWPDPPGRVWPRETDENQLAMTYTIKWPLLKYLYNLYPWHPMKSVPHFFLYCEECISAKTLSSSGMSGSGGHMGKQEMKMEVEWKLETENENGNWKRKWKCANRWRAVLCMRKV